MSDSPSDFGALFKNARERAGFRTISSLADALSEVGLPYSDDAISHWEKNRRTPPRDVLLQTLELLAERKGILALREVDAMFTALGLSSVNSTEQTTYFPKLAYVLTIENLPQRPYDRLIGRDDFLDDLIPHLSDPRAKQVVVISGLGGIGKTALTYELVVRVMGLGVFDRLAWFEARSEEFVGTAIRQRQRQQVNLRAILLSYAQQLGCEVPPNITEEALITRLRSFLRTGSYLLVLDNLETLETALDVTRQLTALVNPPATTRPSKILITSRERLVELDVYDKFVRGLSEPASLEFLALEASNRGAKGFMEHPPDMLKKIYRTTGGMPLALKLIISQFLLQIPLTAELERLQKAENEEQLYRFIYFSLWRKLSEHAQQILVAAAGFATSAQPAMLIPVSRLDEMQFHNTIPELTRMSLIESLYNAKLSQQRYDIHPMTRWFVNAPLAELWNRQKAKQHPPDQADSTAT